MSFFYAHTQAKATVRQELPTAIITVSERSLPQDTGNRICIQMEISFNCPLGDSTLKKSLKVRDLKQEYRDAIGEPKASLLQPIVWSGRTIQSHEEDDDEDNT